MARLSIRLTPRSRLLIASSKCGVNLFKYATGMIDISSVQQSLPDNGIYINVSKNKNDLFIWAADKKSKRAFIIENGYQLFRKFITENEKIFISGKDLNRITGELTAILSSLNEILKDKQVILISADSETEKLVSGVKSVIAA